MGMPNGGDDQLIQLHVFKVHGFTSLKNLDLDSSDASNFVSQLNYIW